MKGWRLDQLDNFLHEVGHVGDARFVLLENRVLDECQVLEAGCTLDLDGDGGSVPHLCRHESEQKLHKLWLLQDWAPRKRDICLSVLLKCLVAENGAPIVVEALFEHYE